eukprot:174958-Chlamydomonas_euryale.AAC.1
MVVHGPTCLGAGDAWPTSLGADGAWPTSLGAGDALFKSLGADGAPRQLSIVCLVRPATWSAWDGRRTHIGTRSIVAGLRAVPSCLWMNGSPEERAPT